MKYDNLRAFEKHLEGAKPLHFSPLYLVMCKEEFECREATALLLNHLLEGQNRELTLKTVEGPHAHIDQLLNDLYSQSMFVPMKVIWIKQAEKLKKGLMDQLEPYLSRIPRGQYLLLSSEGIAKNTRFYKAAEKEGVVLEIPELKPWEKEKRLIEWVSKKAVESRKLLSLQACQGLVKHVGCDAQILGQELEKLFCYVGVRQEITLQDVAHICTSQHDDSVWQLGEAILRKDTAAALQISRYLLVNGQALILLLRQLRSQFQTQLQISTLLRQGKDASHVQQEYPYMKGQILERNISYATHYGFERLRQAMLALEATEMGIKNSQADEQLLADLLMIQLTKRHHS